MTGPPFVLFGATTPQWARVSSFTRFLDHTQRYTTVGMTPLDEWSTRRYLTTHNTHNRQISMPPVGFETANLSRREAADPRLRPRGHWDRQTNFNFIYNSNIHVKGMSWAGWSVTGHIGPSDWISGTPGLTLLLNWRKTRWRTEGGIEEVSVWDVTLLPSQ